MLTALLLTDTMRMPPCTHSDCSPSLPRPSQPLPSQPPSRHPPPRLQQVPLRLLVHWWMRRLAGQTASGSRAVREAGRLRQQRRLTC